VRELSDLKPVLKSECQLKKSEPLSLVNEDLLHLMGSALVQKTPTMLVLVLVNSEDRCRCRCPAA